MEKALKELSTKPDLIIIDAISLPSVSIKQFSPLKADSKSAAVAGCIIK